MEQETTDEISGFFGVNDVNKKTVEQLSDLMVKVTAIAPSANHLVLRTRAPKSILGREFIETLKHAGNFKSWEEAEHMATLMLHFGFVYSVFDENLMVVKNDDTVYRIQRPYFWPYVCKKVTSIEYAVYLRKKVVNNVELNPEEVAYYNKYLELLGHHWDFVKDYADQQLELMERKSRAERAVLKSDEKAFWRFRKPGPNALEVPAHKLLKKLRAPTAEILQNEIEIMAKSLKEKPWLQAEICQQRMIETTTKLQEFDPMFNPPLPSNPWITDDPTYFTLNSDSSDVPTESKIREWAIGFKFLMFDKMGRQALESFMDSEFSGENIRFWNAVQELKEAPISMVDEKAMEIYKEFVATSGQSTINVSTGIREQVDRAMKEGRRTRYAFSAAEDAIYFLIERDTYPRFIQSDFYNELLKSAQQTGNRRSWIALLKPKTKGAQKSAAAGKRSGPGGEMHEATSGEASGISLSQKIKPGGISAGASPKVKSVMKHEEMRGAASAETITAAGKEKMKHEKRQERVTQYERVLPSHYTSRDRSGSEPAFMATSGEKEKLLYCMPIT